MFFEYETHEFIEACQQEVRQLRLMAEHIVDRTDPRPEAPPPTFLESVRKSLFDHTVRLQVFDSLKDSRIRIIVDRANNTLSRVNIEHMPTISVFIPEQTDNPYDVIVRMREVPFVRFQYVHFKASRVFSPLIDIMFTDLKSLHDSLEP